MIKRPSYAIHVWGWIVVLLLFVSFLALTLFADSGEAAPGTLATGHTSPVQPHDEELHWRRNSRLLWRVDKDSIYRWTLPLVTSTRCRPAPVEEWSPGQQSSFVPDCWLALFSGGT